MPEKSVRVITLGCSKNIVDSEHIAGHLRKAGFKLFFDRSRNDCDIVIVNTCGFIGDAKEESINVLLEQIAIVVERIPLLELLISVGFGIHPGTPSEGIGRLGFGAAHTIKDCR